MKWPGYALLHGHNPLYETFLGLPQTINDLWQPPAMPAAATILTPVELVFGPFITYNLLVTLALVTSAWAAYAAIRRWVGGFVGPFIGGAIFGFSPYMIAQSLGHPNLTLLFPIPLALLLLSDLFVFRQRSARSIGFLLGLDVAFEFLTSQEICVSLLLAALAMILVLAISRPAAIRDRAGDTIRAAGAALGVAVPILAYPIYVQFKGPGRLHGLLRPLNTYVSDLTNLVLPNPVAAEFSPRNTSYLTLWHWDVAEMGIYVGVPLLLLLFVVIVRYWDVVLVRTSAIAALAMLVLSFGPSLHVGGLDIGIPLPWRVFEKLPLFNNALPIRFGSLWQLGVAVLVAYAIRRLGMAAARTRNIYGALTLACLLPLLPNLHYPTYTPTVPAFFKTSDVNLIPAGSRVFVAPFPRDQPDDVSPILWQVSANFRFRMSGGYVLVPGPSGQGLGTTGGAEDGLTAALDAIASGSSTKAPNAGEIKSYRNDLRDYFRPQEVIVGPMPGEAEAVALMEQVLRNKPTYVGGIYLWSHPWMAPSQR